MPPESPAPPQSSDASCCTAPSGAEALGHDDPRREVERLRLMIAQAPAAIATSRGPAHVFTSANALYQQITGRRPLLGKTAREAFPELVGQGFHDLLDQVYATGKPFVGKEVLARYDRDGDGRLEDAYFDFTYQALLDPAGRVEGILTFAQEVTEQVLARRRIRMSEERYRSLVDATSQIIWTNSPEGEMRAPQPGWASLTGQSPEEYEGFGWSAAVHPEDRERTIEMWREAVRTRGTFICEHRVRRHDGVWRHFAIRAVPVLEEDGTIREWVGVHTDVTGPREAEAERERLIGALRRSNDELDQFAYVASHDLKAPLRGIANLSQWIEEDLGEKVDVEGREHMRLLRGRVARLEALIDGILTYSRAGRARHEPEPVDTRRLARDVVDLLCPAPGAQVEIADDMPTLVAERVPLQQVFLNLVGNALKHARRPDPKVTISARDLEDAWEFAIGDDGPGIPPMYHERIWGIFQTLEARDVVEGTGIGLSVVKKLVETRGGRVTVESASDAGATFRFTWPKSVGRTVASGRTIAR